MTGPSLLIQAALLAVVGGFTIVHHPFYYQQPIVSGWKQINVRSDATILPCPGPGFYVNPQNCSRFYRCVDYVGTGTLFSRYHFECPTNHIFLTAAQACLPGNCNGLVQPVVQPTQQPTVVPVPVTEPAVPSQTEAPMPVEPETEIALPQTTDSVTAEVQTEAPTEAPATVLTPTEAPATALTPTEAPATALTPTEASTCPDKYVQHPEYCNIYNPCNEPFIRYVCPTGTVFDQPRQMCRISASDDGLCIGKAIFEDALLLRAGEVGGGHVLLPSNYVLPSARPAPMYLRPVGRPDHIFIRPSITPIFRPVMDRPAQTYRRPGVFSPNFNSAFGALQPIHNVAVPYRQTKLQTLANVRRPEGHLHFPLVHFYGSRGEVELA